MQTVRDHMRLECEGDWDEAPVRGYFAASRVPLPDQANDITAIGASGDSVRVEFWLTGTHLGPLRTPKGEIAPTGRAFRVRMMASFEFAPGTAKIICERPYYDRRAVVTALGLG
jgi:SnoaL-like polyketide cyclase